MDADGNGRSRKNRRGIDIFVMRDCKKLLFLITNILMTSRKRGHNGRKRI